MELATKAETAGCLCVRAIPVPAALLGAVWLYVPFREPFVATIKEFLMWCGQRRMQVGQHGLPVSCILWRVPGVAVALQSLVLQFSVQRLSRPLSVGSTTCTQDLALVGARWRCWRS